jgi:hypothetical protein
MPLTSFRTSHTASDANIQALFTTYNMHLKQGVFLPQGARMPKGAICGEGRSAGARILEDDLTSTIGRNYYVHPYQTSILPYMYPSLNGSPGKYYWELEIVADADQSRQFWFGVSGAMSWVDFYNDTSMNAWTHNTLTLLGDATVSEVITYCSTGNTHTGTGYAVAINVPGNILRCAYDADAGTAQFWVNNISLGTTAACWNMKGRPTKAFMFFHESAAATYKWNISGPFVYAKPAGYSALNYRNEVT